MTTLGNYDLLSVYQKEHGYQIRSLRRMTDDPFLYSHALELDASRCDFEVPVFLLASFASLVNSNDVGRLGKLVAYLSVKTYCDSYKTAMPSMRELTKSCFTEQGLAKLKIVGKPFTYYGSVGALFDHALTPVYVSSWQLRREASGDHCTYQFIKPVFRLSPTVFLGSEDIIQKFVCNKLLKLYMSNSVYPPYVGGYFDRPQRAFPIETIISHDWPFFIRKPSEPTISTTNDSLLKVALEHCGEIVDGL